MATNLQQTVRDPLLSNWVKGGLVLKFTKYGIQRFVDAKVNAFHQGVLTNICQGTICNKCTTHNVLSCRTEGMCPRRGGCSYHDTTDPLKKSGKCPSGVCDAFRNTIINSHRHRGPSWRNTNALNWCSNSWEVAKCYMAVSGYSGVKSAADTDLPGLLSVIINLKDFQNYVSENLDHTTNKNNLFSKARDIRNEILHTSTFQLSETELNDYIDIMVKLLRDSKQLAADIYAQDAINKLNQIKNGTVDVTDVDEKKLRKEALQAITEATNDGVQAVNAEGNKQREQFEDMSREKISELVRIFEERKRELNETRVYARQTNAMQVNTELTSAQDETEHIRKEIKTNAPKYQGNVAVKIRQLMNTFERPTRNEEDPGLDMTISASTVIKNSNNSTITETVRNQHEHETSGYDNCIVTTSASTVMTTSNNSMITEPQNKHQYDKSGSDNFKDHAEMSIMEYSKKACLFVKTPAYQTVVKLLDDRNCALIVGNAGEGKSTLVKHLMLEHKEQNYELITVTSPYDWKEYVSGCRDYKKQFVFIDDMFGTFNTDEQKLNEWISLLELMEDVVRGRNGDLKLVCTTRVLIWYEVSAKLNRFYLLSAISTAIMECLSTEDKIDMLERYFKHYQLPHNPDTFKMICKMAPPYGFPHCVEMFCTNSEIRQQGTEFFKKPLSFIREELEMLFQMQDKTTCALIFTLLSKDNTFKIDSLHDTDMHSSDTCKLALSVSSLQSDISCIADAVKRLDNVYLQLHPDGSVTFKHATFKEILSIIFTEKSPVQAIKVLDLSFLVENTKWKESQNNRHNIRFVMLPRKRVRKALLRRFTKELRNRQFIRTFKHDAWEDRDFISSWLSHLTSESPIAGTTALEQLLSARGQNEIAPHTGLLAALILTRREHVIRSLFELPYLSEFWETFESHLLIRNMLDYAKNIECPTHIYTLLLTKQKQKKTKQESRSAEINDNDYV